MAIHENYGSETHPPTAVFDREPPLIVNPHQLTLVGLAKTLDRETRQALPTVIMPDMASITSARLDRYNASQPGMLDGVITIGGLRRVSAELFGTARYGSTAYSMLNQARERYRRMTIPFTTGDAPYNPTSKVEELLGVYLAQFGASERKAEHTAHENAELARAPFNFALMTGAKAKSPA